VPAAVDVLIIGGGISGAGLLRDCALRGWSALLVDKGRFALGTTHASTRLIHGGLRYLLYDRLATHVTSWDSGHIVRIARPLLTRTPILWPVYEGHDHGLETVETLLEAYDPFQEMKLGLPHLRLSREEALRLMPGLEPQGLRGAVSFDEWWVDPVSLVKKNIDSARSRGAQALEATAAVSFLKEGSRVVGARLKGPAGETEVRAGLTVNASGPWVHIVGRGLGVEIPMRLMQGTHLVFKGRLVPSGLLVEAAGGGRYVFILPLGEETLVGPTDVPLDGPPDSAKPSEEEIRYLLASVRRYFPSFPERFDHTVCGVRPILGQKGPEKLLTRDYEILDHSKRDGLEGVLTLAGGKMSSFRLMAEDTADVVGEKLGKASACRTHLETLDGGDVGAIPDHALPPDYLKTFLARHPRLRELHALAHLGAAYARHLARPRRPAPADYAGYYGLAPR
jgi:glycerol-3-phosphate dehydrogenase